MRLQNYAFPALLFAVSFAVSGCEQHIPYPPMTGYQPAPVLPEVAYAQPWRQPQPRVFRGAKGYVSSHLGEASHEPTDPPTWKQPVGYVSSYVRAYNPNDMADLKALQTEALTDMWMEPEAEVKPSMVIRDPELRAKLNEVLASPQPWQEWQHGNILYLFEANGPAYKAAQTGERCRDGILTRATQHKSERMRGLFCQKAHAADWELVR